MYNNISMIKGGNKGFTIVETLIVLAIAATIILVVLLAVPGLQRGSRNTTARTAASNIIAGWNEQVAALNGASPGVPTAAAGTITINNVVYKLATGVTPTIGTVAAATTVGYSASAAVFASGGTTSVVAPNTLIVATSATCNGNNAAALGTTTNIAVFYPVENGGTGAVGCIQGKT